MSVFRRRWLSAALLAASAACLACRGAGGPLPPGSALGGYTDAGDVESYTALTLYAYMDGGADVFQEYGVSRAWVRRYARGSSELTVELYEMRDGPAAAALWSYMRRAGTETDVAPGCRGSLTESEAKLAKGRHYLVCRNDDPMAAPADAVRDLCAGVAGAIEGSCGVGPLFDGLDDGRVKGTEVALLGPLGFNLRPWLTRVEREGFTRGWLASYSLAAGSAEALVAEYASSAAAQKAVASLAGRKPAADAVAHRGQRIVVVHAEGAPDEARRDLAQRLLAR